MLGALLAFALAPAAVAGPGISITAVASPDEIPIGAAVTVSGRITGEGAPAPGRTLELEAAPYPFRRFTPVAGTQSATDGSFAFAATAPGANTRVRVSLAGTTVVTSTVLAVTVDPRIAIHARSYRPGRERLSIRVLHGRSTRPLETRVSWYLAAGGSRRFVLAATTTSRELSAGLTYASTIVDPPARRFAYRVCLSREAGMGPAPKRGACGGELVASGKALGIPQPPFPSAAAIEAAESYLEGRAGTTALAVVDSAGRLSGLNLNEHFETASVIKVMMLTAYLQLLSAQHRGLTSSDNALLYPMIHESNNEDASAVLGIVGQPAVERVARESGMRAYVPGVGWWAYSQTSAADQARFFYALARLIPARFWPYARGLMSGIEPSQSWGFPPVARPRWQVFFKTGALPEEGLFNEVARLERGTVTFTVAVLSDGDPSMAYGEQTIEGVAERLLAGTP